jgi:hypothetical protein
MMSPTAQRIRHSSWSRVVSLDTVQDTQNVYIHELAPVIQSGEHIATLKCRGGVHKRCRRNSRKRFSQLVDVRGRGNIGLDGEHVRSAARRDAGEILRGLIKRFAVEVCHTDAQAKRRQTPGGGETDPTSSTRDHRAATARKDTSGLIRLLG